jgi:HPt (histidine-containing phosphotransfer) domain-containing protein
MGSIKHQPRAGISTVDRLAASEKLQELFAVRLQSERVHFVTLSAALARAEESPAGIFDDLTFRAHRLKGAAATFEFADLAAAAGALEQASFAAATLVQMLGTFEDTARHESGIDAAAHAD